MSIIMYDCITNYVHTLGSEVPGMQIESYSSIMQIRAYLEAAAGVKLCSVHRHAIWLQEYNVIGSESHFVVDQGHRVYEGVECHGPNDDW